jgi:hypothetical protein
LPASNKLTVVGYFKMTVNYKEFTVDIIDDSTFSRGSTDNVFTYDKVYVEGTEQQTSKHGIRVFKDDRIVSSAILCGTGGSTGIFDDSFIVTGNTLLICCGDNVFSLKLPALTLDWKKKFDLITCFAIYPYKDDFIVHGELEVKKIDLNGNIKWSFSARDIFVTQDGNKAVKFLGDKIELTDWENNKYIINEHGQLTE